MKCFWVVCLIALLCRLSQANFISRIYTAKLELDNKTSNEEFLGENKVQSLFKCSLMCQNNCTFFGYNPKLKKCRTHKKIFKTDISDEAEWRYFFHHLLPVDNQNLHDKCHTNSDLPLDCKDLKENCQTNSGVYVIYPYGDHSRPVRVFCDMETMDGGWTAIQKRINGSLKFSKNWAKYKDGFGAAEKDYWIGNDVIRQLTKGKNSGLYVSFKLTDGSRPYEVYDRFWISSEAEKYKLNLRGDFRGTLGDSMMKTGSSSTVLNGMFFSTSDRDNDRHGGLNCADLYKGGWWFNSCHRAFLNGKWLSRGWEYPWSSKFQSGTSVRETIMMIKRH